MKICDKCKRKFFIHTIKVEIKRECGDCFEYVQELDLCMDCTKRLTKLFKLLFKEFGK